MQVGGALILAVFLGVRDKSESSPISDLISILLPFPQLEVHQPNTLRSYMRKHNMMVAPPMELPAHLERRRRRRSSFYDEKTEEREMMLLRAGVKPQWLQIHRVINHRSGRRGHDEYLVKWRDLPYDQATWEKLGSDCPYRGASDAIRQYNKLRSVHCAAFPRPPGMNPKLTQVG